MGDGSSTRACSMLVSHKLLASQCLLLDGDMLQLLHAFIFLNREEKAHSSMHEAPG